MNKQPGRPRNGENPATVAADAAIARTIYQLSCWGVPLRSYGESIGALEVVAAQALLILGRGDSYSPKRALGQERVEQIFEVWFDAEQSARKARRGAWPLLERWRYTKVTLSMRNPAKNLSLDSLAAELLRNGGEWVRQRSPFSDCGDLELSPRGYEKLGPGFRFVKPRKTNIKRQK